MSSASKDDRGMDTIAKRYAEDEAFREVANMLYGDGVIIKANPDQADLHARRKREKKQARIGLATNIVGIGAGIAATPPALKAASNKYREMKGQPPKTTQHKAVTSFQRLKPVKATRKVLKTPKGAFALASGAAGLQVGNLAGDAIANRVLSREAKKNPDVMGGSATAVRHTKKKVADIHKSLSPLPEYDIKWEGEISKISLDKQQVFGWASIVEMNGEPVVDLQGDYIAIDEVEKSAYEYVHKSRKGGDMHLRDGDEPVVKSHMIESFVVTPEKKKALNLPEDTPTGWWVGYQINDPNLWDAVKSGKRTGFSIHGRGIRTPANEES